MGSSSYGRASYDGKSSYNGKSSYDSNTERESKVEKLIQQQRNSPMEELLKLLGKVEGLRTIVEAKERDVQEANYALMDAKKALEEAEQEVVDQVNKLDPQIRDRFRRMMGGNSSHDSQGMQGEKER